MKIATLTRDSPKIMWVRDLLQFFRDSRLPLALELLTMLYNQGLESAWLQELDNSGILNIAFAMREAPEEFINSVLLR